MINIAKWNFETHEYEPYEVPEGVELVLYTPDMSQIIPCASCFTPLDYGSTYTSRTLHTTIGMGYPICEACYEKEWAAEKAAKS